MPAPSTRTPPRVRVVVLNWNAWWFTRRCLRSLLATDHPPDRLELVLVDNASVDGSLERLRLEFPQVRVIANPANLGFAEGCNRAMRDLDDVDLVALVNNDAMVEPGWLAAAVQALEALPGAGAAAARLVLEPTFVRIELHVEGVARQVHSVRVDGVDATSRTRFDGAVRSEGRTEWPLELVHHLDPGTTTASVPVGEGTHLVEVTLSDGVGEHGDGAGGARAVPTVGGTAVEQPAVRAHLHDRQVVAGRSGVHLVLSVPVEADDDRVELLNGLGTARNEVAESYDRHFGAANDPAAVPELAGPPVEVPGFSGGGVVLRAQMLREVGLFDPRFFAYYEDSDLSWRAARAGWRTVTAPGAVIRHAFGGSGGARAPGFFFLNYRNWLLTVLRNASPAQRRAALRSARERMRWALRANVASPLKHRRRPDTSLAAAWARTWAGVADVRRAQRGDARRSDGRPVGAVPTDRVHSSMQPHFAPRSPSRRPGGPVLVALDLTDELARPGAGVQLLADLVGADQHLEVVPVRRAGADGQWSWVEPAQLSRLLGLDVPGRHVDAAELAFGPLPEGTVLVWSPGPSAGLVARPAGDRSCRPIQVPADPGGLASMLQGWQG